MNQITEKDKEQRTNKLNKPSHTCGYCDEEEGKPKEMSVSDDIHSYEIYCCRRTGRLNWFCANCWTNGMMKGRPVKQVEDMQKESHTLKLQWHVSTRPVITGLHCANCTCVPNKPLGDYCFNKGMTSIRLEYHKKKLAGKTTTMQTRLIAENLGAIAFYEALLINEFN